ncbi:CBM35 domain-containing protein [Spirillospora sp. CA-142024]|uniref:CBM35 domain-containing protein n=1 Tax=Spirillospora sp. CA-142024 TaxID=3240036 RepID=UPI003D8AD8FF
MGGLAVNGRKVRNLAASAEAKVFLTGGVNKMTVTGERGRLRLDRLRTESTAGTLNTTWYEAEGARLAGTAQVTASSLAGGGKAVTGIGGERGNANTLTFDVAAPVAGRYALTVRYSKPEQSPATHYNPDPLARHADVSVNGETRRVLFPHTFHANNYWQQTIQVDLKAGANTISFGSEELPNFDGKTYISETFPDVLLRSKYAPIIDRIGITPFTGRD